MNPRVVGLTVATLLASQIHQLPEVAALRKLMTSTGAAGGGGGGGGKQSGMAVRGRVSGVLFPYPSRARMTRRDTVFLSHPTTLQVVLLDEMDQLVSKAQGILYELFGLPTLKGSRCVLVGVANAINLTDRVLPRLRARGCEPALVSFPAYNKDQLKALLSQRLNALPWRTFESAALELCSRKVAAATGDMRRALNICAAAIDFCIADTAAAKMCEAEERAYGGGGDDDEGASHGTGRGAHASRRTQVREKKQPRGVPPVRCTMYNVRFRFRD